MVDDLALLVKPGFYLKKQLYHELREDLVLPLVIRVTNVGVLTNTEEAPEVHREVWKQELLEDYRSDAPRQLVKEMKVLMTLNELFFVVRPVILEELLVLLDHASSSVAMVELANETEELC